MPQQGPLIDSAAVAKAESNIKDAVSKGAKVLPREKRHSRGGTFFEQSILGNATEQILIASEEAFGPIAPLYRSSTEED